MDKKELLAKEILELEGIKDVKLVENKNIQDGYTKLVEQKKEVEKLIPVLEEKLNDIKREIENAKEARDRAIRNLTESQERLNVIEDKEKLALEAKSKADKEKEEAVKEKVKEQNELEQLMKKRLEVAKKDEQNQQMRAELKEYYRKIGEPFPYED